VAHCIFLGIGSHLHAGQRIDDVDGNDTAIRCPDVLRTSNLEGPILHLIAIVIFDLDQRLRRVNASPLSVTGPLAEHANCIALLSGCLGTVINWQGRELIVWLSVPVESTS